jgi:cytosine/uracil/thiamine/allantoin permease
LKDSNAFLFRWLIASSSLLGSVAGVMLADYFVLRKTELLVPELYMQKGIYWFHNGVNWRAFVACAGSILPVFPGFLWNVSDTMQKVIPDWMGEVYKYSWFICFGLSFGGFILIQKIFPAKGYDLALKEEVIISSPSLAPFITHESDVLVSSEEIPSVDLEPQDSDLKQ